jgi:hypothetical protein
MGARRKGMRGRGEVEAMELVNDLRCGIMYAAL